MSRISRKEIVGFISLAILVIAILLGAFILRRSDASEPGLVPQPRPTVVSAETEGWDESSASQPRSRKSGRKKKASKSSRSSKTKKQDHILEYDPLCDTIPVDFDEY